MTTYFESALNLWEQLKFDKLEFGRTVLLAQKKENKTIRDFSIALCGNLSLEDKIGRYVMAAEFADSLTPVQYEEMIDWLTPSHFTELHKYEREYDHEAALDLMNDLITENPDGSVNVKPADYIRAKRNNEETSREEIFHRFWKQATRALLEMQSKIESLGQLATPTDKKMLGILKAAVKYFQAKNPQVTEKGGDSHEVIT